MHQDKSNVTSTTGKTDELAKKKRHGRLSRREFLGLVGVTSALGALIAADLRSPDAFAAQLSWPVPTGELKNTVDGKQVVKCYSPSTVATFTEVLGLSNPSFYATEYNDARYKDDLSLSPTLGIWGSSINSSPDAYLSNLLYKSKGHAVDETYVAVLGSALQGASQLSSLDSDGLPLYLKHRPDMLTIDPNEGWMVSRTETGKTIAQYIQQINALDPTSDAYQKGDESYNPTFVNFRDHYGDKLGYMYSLWEVVQAADEMLAKDTTKTGRYGSLDDIAGDVEQFMLASQYAVLREIETGATKRKVVAVIGGVSDQTTGVINGVDTSTGRARIDEFNASTKDFSTSTQWGGITNFNVRYYHAAAALENCCDSIADVLGVSDASDTDAPIIRDSNGVLWARPEALMQCDAIIIRTQTTVTTIPGTDELYSILRQYGYTDQNKWPPIFTSNPTLGGYGASNCSQLFWWYAYLFFVYPEVINPVYMSAFMITDLYHIASSGLEQASDILCGDMSLPEGYELSFSGYDEAKVRRKFADGLEYYLANKSEIDKKHPNLEMTDQMRAWLTNAKLAQLGVNVGLRLPKRVTGADRYESMAKQILTAWSKASTIVVASGTNFQDALAATPLARLYSAPVVLVPKTLAGGKLPASISDLIAKLGAKKYLIVGDKKAVPASVESALKKLGLKSEAARIYGSTHVNTAAQVYTRAKAKGKKWGKTAIIASSKSFVGALAISAYAYANKFPIFFVNGSLNSATKKALRSFKKVIIAGGTKDVSRSVERVLKRSKTVTRWGGTSANATAYKILTKTISGNLGANRTAVVSSSSWTEALAAGCVCGKRKAGIAPLTYAYATKVGNYLAQKKAKEVYVFGGTSAVTVKSYDRIQKALS